MPIVNTWQEVHMGDKDDELDLGNVVLHASGMNMGKVVCPMCNPHATPMDVFPPPDDKGRGAAISRVVLVQCSWDGKNKKATLHFRCSKGHTWSLILSHGSFGAGDVTPGEEEVGCLELWGWSVDKRPGSKAKRGKVEVFVEVNNPPAHP